MNRKISNLFLLSLFPALLIAQNSGSKIILQGQTPPGFPGEVISFTSFPTHQIDYKEIIISTTETKIKDGNIKLELPAEGPTRIFGSFLGNSNYFSFLAEPGDSLMVHYENKKPVYSGSGAVFMNLLRQLKEAEDSVDKLEIRSFISRSNAPTVSTNDYLEWNNFLKIKSSVLLPIVNSYRTRLSKAQFKDAQLMVLKEIEKRRLWKFNYLRTNTKKDSVNQYGLSNSDLCKIFDSTMNTRAANSLFQDNELDTDLYYQWSIIRLMLYWKKGKFFQSSQNEPPILGKDREDAFILQYDYSKKNYKGAFREKLLAYTFCDIDGLFTVVGFTPKVDSLLRDYYKQPGFTEYKAMVKSHEVIAREKFNKTTISPFTLTDQNGNTFFSESLKGKLSIYDFWFTGCTGCIQMNPSLNIVEEYFKNDTNVVFIKVSVDRNFGQWQKSLQDKKYVSGNGIQLYTSGQGMKHDIISRYDINAFPELFLVDPSGGIIPYNHFTTDPRKDNGISLINLIRKELANAKDGPYIFQNGQDSLVSWQINGDAVTRQFYSVNTQPSIVCRTDDNTSFYIQLKSSTSTEPVAYDRPEDLIIFSDIEGNFKALKKLLVSNKIIDEQLNWKFGKGHLVFAGDMFDRGNQVTECLWLIYSLEAKAQAEGGYVHFILGNHELMNLQGNHKYTVNKYHNSVAKMGMSLTDIYKNESELGKWLRTKNIIEKIGDLLITHGGISEELNKMPLSIADINSLTRPYYDAPRSAKDTITKILMSTLFSPHWYRGYYTGKTIATENQIDSTLRKFGVDHIITGHTIMADTISTYFNNKVINTDTRHAEGFSEALLISGTLFFRVNAEGQRVLLFDDRRKK